MAASEASSIAVSEASSSAALELLRGSWHIMHLSASSLPSSLMKVHLLHVQVEILAAIMEGWWFHSCSDAGRPAWNSYQQRIADE
mmetsp:Transcript_38460/g.69319  ORF Transcript_38460/g.69319 Transcript_38460/m.69319 type:complete len:85 (-) Transcript_38460:9-263(-)